MSDFWGLFSDNYFPTGLFPDYVAVLTTAEPMMAKLTVTDNFATLIESDYQVKIRGIGDEVVIKL